MKKLLLALVLFASVTALIIYGLRDRDSDPDEETAALPTEVAPDPEPADDVVELIVDEGDDEEVVEDAESSRTEVPLTSNLPGRFGAWEEGQEHWLEGRISIPPGAPADPTLKVIALIKDLGPQQLYGPRGPATELGRRDPATANSALVAVEQVATDGTFRIPVPSATSAAWLAVDGRYLYSPYCQEVTLAEAQEPTIVTTELGGRITGQVLLPIATPNRAPVFEKMRVLLVPDVNEFSLGDTRVHWLMERRAGVASNGTYEVRAVAPGQTYELGSDSDDFAVFQQSGVEAEPGHDTILDISLVKGAVVRGVVRDKEGNPIANARVGVKGTIFWGIPSRAYLSERSAEDGTFEFTSVPPRKVALTAEHDGYLDAAMVELELENLEERSDVEMILDPGFSITGTVHWPDGAPAKGADVDVSFDPAALMGAGAFNAMRGAEGDGEADEEGGFTVTGLGKGPFEVTVTAAERNRKVSPAADDSSEEEPPVWRAHRAGVRPDGEPLELVLTPPLVLIGRVENEAAEPIPEFTVDLAAPGAVMWMPADSRTGHVTNDEGRFRFDDLKEGAWEVTVTAEGYGASAPIEVSLPQSAEEPLVIVLRPAAAVEGLVVDPTGRPVTGATVTVETDPQKNIARLRGNLRVPETHSDELGAFRLDGLSAGTTGLIALHGEFAPSEAASISIEAGTVIENVVLTLRVGGTLTGEVYGKDEELASGVTVIVQNPASIGTPTITRTDDEGFFRVEHLRPGQWQVTAMLDEAGGASMFSGEEIDLSAIMENIRFTMVEIADEETEHVVLGAPAANPVRVYGTVTHTGEPLGGAMVSFIPQDATGLGAMKFTQLDENGKYELRVDEPGEFLMQVQMIDAGTAMQQSSIEYVRNIPEVEEHRLDIELPVGRISGRVIGPDGKPLEGARVTLTIDGGLAYGTFMGGRYGEGASDAKGYYEFEFLRPGTYTVAAGGSMLGGVFGSRSENGRQVRGGLSVSEGQHVDHIDFRLRRAGNISGTVLDESGRPVGGVAIFVRDEDGNLLERFSMITSGPDGSFSYTSVAPGGYTVTGRGFGYASLEGDMVQVEEGQTSKITLTLVQGTILIVSVTDESGEDVRATVSVKDTEGREVNGMIAYTELASALSSGSLDGSQRVGPLPPGRYVVTVTADDGRTATKPANLSGQDERKLRIRLR